MNRLSALILLCLGTLGLQAQTSSSITISTSPSGPRFQVDGTTYTAPVTFIWPSGSTHYVVFITDPPTGGSTAPTAVQTSFDGSTQWAFSGWQTNNGLITPASTPVQTITANPAITTFTASVTVSYRLNLLYNGPAPAVPPTCNSGAPGAIPAGQTSPGVVYVSGTCFWSSETQYVAAGGTLTLNAYPYPGFAFSGWSINSATPTPFVTTVTINTPTNVTPVFVPAKRVSFLTSPPGLQVLVDHTPVPTRTEAVVPACPNNETLPINVLVNFPPLCYGDFDFVPGSTHFISGVTPQRDTTGNWWVFNNWSNGLGQNGLYQVDNNANVPATLTANFVQGAQVSLVTTPSGLKLTVDGDANYTSYNFVWGVGTSHQVIAPMSQKGSDGRVYTFQSWSNQADPSETINVDSGMTASGYRLIANYNQLSRVVVQSSPSGLKLKVDGLTCQTPCNVDRQNGATIHVSAPTQLALGQGARLDFSSWTDGAASDHVITVSQNYAVATAIYTTSYQLSASSNPANGASFQMSPSSSDMFYPQGTQVAITATANKGFKFGHWTGDLTGSYASGTVTMLAPIAVVAEMASVPYISPAGILNGVGPTPSMSVAPGSVISIYGQNLATVTQVGSVNPLPQTIAGTSVTINGSILPLLFVSAQQINAQLPSTLPDGDYTLEVQNTGQPAIEGSLTVARNAPGLFYSTVGSTNYAMAFHADGSAVTVSSPAAGGETISILGTGFGPYQSQVLDGFFPPNPPPAVADSVALSVNGSDVDSTSTAAPNYTGLVSTEFQVPSGLASGTPVPVFVTINGVDSDTVMLPIQ